jgi:hypothetical protein
MPSHIARRAALALAICTLTTNCSFGPRNDEPSDLAARSGSATVIVRNHNFNDMRIYELGSGDRSRIGTVGGESNATFQLPAWMIANGHISLVGDPIGGTVLAYSGTIALGAGSVVTFTIEQNVAMSAAVVR